MFCATLSLLFLCIHNLDCGVIQHFLPGIVELPLVRVAHETLLGQRNGFLGRRVDLVRTLILQGGRLTLQLGHLCLLERLIVRSCLFDATAELLRGELQSAGRLVHQYPKGRIRFL
uniref:Putative secreted protein n=1 Tax=Anopheles darlingi TaxID=43151 RepID=A0A2M4DJN2_ANODA